MGPILDAAFPVIPVLTIHRIEHAVPLATALVDGGLSTLEVTLRTEVAWDAIRAIKLALPDAVVGAGTVLSGSQFRRLEQLGADFAVSPGATASLLREGRQAGLPFLPAVATASELMSALELGYQCFKFFPATACGGVAALVALAGPFPQARFCPSGGIHAQNYIDFVNLASVPCVGGSWMAPQDAVESQDWERVKQLAGEAVAGAHKSKKKLMAP